jgi:hypothetical protein
MALPVAEWSYQYQRSLNGRTSIQNKTVCSEELAAEFVVEALTSGVKHSVEVSQVTDKGVTILIQYFGAIGLERFWITREDPL